MPIHFTCASCAAKLKVDDKLAGKSVRCPKCKTVGQIPSPDLEPELDYQVKGNDDDFWGETAGLAASSPALPSSSPLGGTSTRSQTPRSGGGPRSRVAVPGTVLWILALLGVGLSVLGIIGDFVVVIMDPDDMPSTNEFVAKIAGSFAFISATVATAKGLNDFRNLRNPSAAWFGLIMAMLPCGTCLFCPLAIPFAIWGMVLMNDKQIQASFRG